MSEPIDKRSKYRADYYKHHERYKESARIRAAAKRATTTETPEQAEERRRKNREWYARNLEERRRKSVEYSRKKRGEEPLPDIASMPPEKQAVFKRLMVALLAKKCHAKLEYRKQWKRKKYGYQPRKKAEQKIKQKRTPLTVEEKRQRQNEYKRRVLVEAKKDPIKLAILRAKRNEMAKKWIETMRVQYPEKYKNYRSKQSAYEVRYANRSFFRKMSKTLRKQVSKALIGSVKSASTAELTGCSLAELRVHLESQFLPNMSWSNFGRGIGKWGIDHVAPLAAHDLSIESEQKKAFHFSNLRPLWHVDNSSKGSFHQGRRWTRTDHACKPPEST